MSDGDDILTGIYVNDPNGKDDVLIGAGKWVPCRICWDIFMRLRLTARYCNTCKRGFCEGEHGNFTGGGGGVCVRCFSRKGMQLA
jgi:hypothetical protein